MFNFRVADNPFMRRRIDDRPSEDPEEVRALKSERPVLVMREGDWIVGQR